MGFRVVLVSPAEAAAFAGMTRAAYLPLLKQEVGGGLALGVWHEAEPVGLALAKLEAEAAELLSIFVKPSWRQHTIATQVLGLLEVHLAQVHPVKRLHASYSTQGRSVAAFEALVVRGGWGAPEVALEVLHFRHAVQHRMAWLQKLSMPPYLQVRPWVELTPAHHAALRARERAMPPDYWPYAPEEHPLDPAASLACMEGEEVVGWILAHQPAPRLTRYSILYLRPPWQRPAWSFAMVAAALRRAEEAYGPDHEGTLGVAAANLPMQRIYQRKLQPFAEAAYELRQVEKVLG